MQTERSSVGAVLAWRSLVSQVVAGVYDDCSSDDCLANKRYNCYALQQLRNANNSCVLDYSPTGTADDGEMWDKGPPWNEEVLPRALVD